MEISIKWNVCRVCLQEEPISEKTNNGPAGDCPIKSRQQFLPIFEDANIAAQIYECSGIVMKSNDSLPEKICRKCVMMLRSAVDFRRRCRCSNEYLSKVVQKTKSATNLFKIDKMRQETHDYMSINDDVYDNSLIEILSGNDDTSAAVNTTEIKSNTTNLHKDLEQDSSMLSLNDSIDIEHDVQNMLNDENEQELIKINSASIKPTASVKILQNKPHTSFFEFVETNDDDIEDTETEPESARSSEINLNSIISTRTFTLTSGLKQESYDEENEDEDVNTVDSGDNLTCTNNVQESVCVSPDNDSINVKVNDNEEGDGNNAFFYIINEEKDINNANDESANNLFNVQNTNNTNTDVNLNDSNTIDFLPMDDETNASSSSCTDAFKSALTMPSFKNIEYIIEEVQEEDEENVDEHVKEITAEVDDNNTNASKKTKMTDSDTFTFNTGMDKKPSVQERRKFVVSAALSCDICSNTFTNIALLKHHIRLHKNDKSFECELCFKKFNTACNLSAHMRVHTGERPYECEYCGRRFTDRSTHIKHERIHTNEKPFRCSYCGKCFSLSTSLKAHERIHTGEKPFRCEICHKAFKLAHQLKAHFKTNSHRNVSTAEKLAN